MLAHEIRNRRARAHALLTAGNRSLIGGRPTHDAFTRQPFDDVDTLDAHKPRYRDTAIRDHHGFATPYAIKPIAEVRP